MHVLYDASNHCPAVQAINLPLEDRIVDQISQSGFHPGNWADRVKLQSYRIDVSRCQPNAPWRAELCLSAGWVCWELPSGPAAYGDYDTNCDIDQGARSGTDSAV